MTRVGGRVRGRAALAAGAGLLVALVLLAAAGPLVVRADPQAVAPRVALASPSAAHPLGTDGLGRDVLSRVLHGGRQSLAAGFAATLVAVLLGASLGALSGAAGRVVDAVLSRAADTVNAFPPLVGALALLGLTAHAWGGLHPGLRTGIIVGLFAWPTLFRFVRAEVRALSGSDLALAARATGAGPLRVAVRHLLPQAAAPALVPASFLAAGAVVVEAGLGFLGLGVPPPNPSWGNLLMEGMSHIETAWWLTAFPGLCIFLTVLGCYLLGEGLREPG